MFHWIHRPRYPKQENIFNISRNMLDIYTGTDILNKKIYLEYLETLDTQTLIS